MTSARRRNFLKVSAGAVGLGALAVLLDSDSTGGDGGDGSSGGPRNVGRSNATRENVAGSYYVTPDENVAGIQRVIDDHGPNVSIELGEGEYVGSELRIAHGVQLLGKGRNATTLKLADGANTDLVTTPSPDERISMQVRFESITFDGNKENNSSGDIIYGAFWNGRFINCDFVGAPVNGFWLAGSSEGSTDDNYVRGCRFVRANNDALRLGTNRQAHPALGVARIHSCWFGNNGGHGVRVRGNGNIISSGKFYANRGADVLLDRGHRNLVADNDMAKENTTAPCVSAVTSQGITASGNRIHRNVIWGKFRDGMYCQTNGDAIEAMQVHDNVITSSGEGHRSGIYADGQGYATCSARNNTFTGSYSSGAMNVPRTWSTSDNEFGVTR